MDLFSFHDTHFGEAALLAFARDFLDPDQAQSVTADEHGYYDYDYEDEEDDGLGYYPDGVKRTLTDEQIAMFRHSELQALQRAQEKTPKKKEPARLRRNSSSPILMDIEDDDEFDEAGEWKGEEVQKTWSTEPKKRRSKKKKKKRGSGNGNTTGGNRKTKAWSPDPERRKRTWDVVETGLDALDYGEMAKSGSAAEHLAQRRRITYEDD